MGNTTAQQHRLAILGGLFVWASEITQPDELRKWGAVLQAFIEVAESHQDPTLLNLVRLKEMVYREWIHPAWTDRRPLEIPSEGKERRAHGC